MDFWARRKAAVEAEAQAEETARVAQEQVAQEAAQAEKTDEELLEELGLPEPESLGPEDDFKAFMAEGVPQRLRARALRCLWRSNPILANVDGLVDYGEDFTDASCVVENLQTAYQVGKGMLKHVEEMAAQAEAKANGQTTQAATEDTEADDSAEETPAVTAETEAPELVEETAEPVAIAAAPTDHTDLDDEAALPPRRRMAFTFDETSA